MNKIKFVLFSAGILLALSLTFSCSGGGGGSGEQSYDYCVMEDDTCLPGPFTASTCKAQLSNSCPDGSTPIVGSLSSSGGGTFSRSSSSNSDGSDKGNNIANYKTIKIGTQTWMAENLNYNVSGSVCYRKDLANCAKYGRLYNWATAMDLPASCNSSSCASRIKAKHQGICPSGWHIPSDDDWDELVNSAGGAFTAGTKLKSKDGWEPYSGVPAGTDEFGFSALPGGGGTADGLFIRVGTDGTWMSACEDNGDSWMDGGNDGDSIYACIWSMFYDNERVSYGSSNKGHLRSVRCVKD